MSIPKRVEPLESLLGKRILCYARQSTPDKQESVANQIDLFNRYQERCGFETAGIVEDRYSAVSKSRPVFDEMCTDIRNGKFGELYGIWFWKVDRLSRDSSFDFVLRCKDLFKLKINFLTAESYGLEEWVLSGPEKDEVEDALLAKVKAARDYSRNVSINVTTTSVTRSLNGQKPMKESFGYDLELKRSKDGKRTEYWRLNENPEESEWVKYAFESYANGSRKTEIMDHLNENNVLTKRGKPWNLQGLTRMLKNDVYIARYVQHRNHSGKLNSFSGDDLQPVMKYERENERGPTANIRANEKAIVKENYTEKIDQLISRELFDAVQARLAEKKEKKEKPSTRKHPFSGIVRCQCGGPMHAKGKDEFGNVHEYVCYKSKRLREKHECPNGRKAVKQETLFEYLTEVLRMLFEDKELHRKVAEKSKEFFERLESSTNDEEVRRIEGEIATLDEEIRRNTQDYLAATLPMMKKSIEEEIAKKEKRRMRLQGELQSVSVSKSEFEDIRQKIKTMFRKTAYDFFVPTDRESTFAYGQYIHSCSEEQLESHLQRKVDFFNDSSKFESVMGTVEFTSKEYIQKLLNRVSIRFKASTGRYKNVPDEIDFEFATPTLFDLTVTAFCSTDSAVVVNGGCLNYSQR